MRIESVLKQRISLLPESNVRDAMEYSLMAGGKRIRPQLLYEVVKGYGKEESVGDEFAAAIEMIHTYSLIHDDLPAMDDDVLRRGRPTCHVKFNEATAILAGDGLLTYAFETAASSCCDPAAVVKCIRILAEMAGASGMVLGQDLDMAESKGETVWEDVVRVHRHKTGCLLAAPLVIGSILSGHEEDSAQWQEAGFRIGLAFQIQDDILDTELTPEEFGKSVSDADNEKVTSIDLLGKENAERLMNSLYDEGEGIIHSFSGFDSSALIRMIEEIRVRRK